ncbi:MAG: uroporphyrinogen decarboxylase family protein [Saccharofermentanales bacterium]
MNFRPDFNNIVNAARNRKPDRMPLYEHGFGWGIISEVTGKNIIEYWTGKEDDLREFFRIYIDFYNTTGQDAVNWDHNIGTYMPGSGALLGISKGVIRDRGDFNRYPWDEIEKRFFEDTTKYFRVLREMIPAGMKAIGGPGNGIYECVVDIVGYTELCYMSVDDPELYADLFRRVGSVNYSIWDRFLREFGDMYCVCKFGDDLGFRSSTLIPGDHIRSYVVPEYRKIADLIHSYGKPFLYHSCGKIFEVMEDIIEHGGIDAKHSNEDGIAPFTEWIDRYGDRIGNFGGIDMDVLCREPKEQIAQRVEALYHYVMDKKGGRGFALGSGNSIPDYVPVSGYMAMNETFRCLRGE